MINKRFFENQEKAMNIFNDCIKSNCKDNKKYNKCIYDNCKKEIISLVKARLSLSIELNKQIYKNLDDSYLNQISDIKNLIKKKNKNNKDINELLIKMNKLNNPKSNKKVIIFKA